MDVSLLSGKRSVADIVHGCQAGSPCLLLICGYLPGTLVALVYSYFCCPSEFVLYSWSLTLVSQLNASGHMQMTCFFVCLFSIWTQSFQIWDFHSSNKTELHINLFINLFKFMSFYCITGILGYRIKDIEQDWSNHCLHGSYILSLHKGSIRQ